MAVNSERGEEGKMAQGGRSEEALKGKRKRGSERGKKIGIRERER